MVLLNPAPVWKPDRSRHIILWHGCTDADRQSIEAKGIDPLQGKPNTDFGRGFYTTTLRYQAEHWAWSRSIKIGAARKNKNPPVILRFRLDRHQLAALHSLAFVNGDYHSEDYWSLVQHCRQSRSNHVRDHKGPVQCYNGEWYDWVCGPVASHWTQPSTMHDADQISFHTVNAAALLTALIQSGKAKDYGFEVVL